MFNFTDYELKYNLKNLDENSSEFIKSLLTETPQVNKTHGQQKPKDAKQEAASINRNWQSMWPSQMEVVATLLSIPIKTLSEYLDKMKSSGVLSTVNSSLTGGLSVEESIGEVLEIKRTLEKALNKPFQLDWKKANALSSNFIANNNEILNDLFGAGTEARRKFEWNNSEWEKTFEIFKKDVEMGSTGSFPNKESLFKSDAAAKKVLGGEYLEKANFIVGALVIFNQYYNSLTKKSPNNETAQKTILRVWEMIHVMFKNFKQVAELTIALYNIFATPEQALKANEFTVIFDSYFNYVGNTQDEVNKFIRIVENNVKAKPTFTSDDLNKKEQKNNTAQGALKSAAKSEYSPKEVGSWYKIAQFNTIKSEILNLISALEKKGKNAQTAPLINQIQTDLNANKRVDVNIIYSLIKIASSVLTADEIDKIMPDLAKQRNQQESSLQIDGLGNLYLLVESETVDQPRPDLVFLPSTYDTVQKMKEENNDINKLVNSMKEAELNAKAASAAILAEPLPKDTGLKAIGRNVLGYFINSIATIKLMKTATEVKQKAAEERKDASEDMANKAEALKIATEQQIAGKILKLHGMMVQALKKEAARQPGEQDKSAAEAFSLLKPLEAFAAKASKISEALDFTTTSEEIKNLISSTQEDAAKTDEELKTKLSDIPDEGEDQDVAGEGSIKPKKPNDGSGSGESALVISKKTNKNSDGNALIYRAESGKKLTNINKGNFKYNTDSTLSATNTDKESKSIQKKKFGTMKKTKKAFMKEYEETPNEKQARKFKEIVNMKKNKKAYVKDSHKPNKFKFPKN